MLQKRGLLNDNNSNTDFKSLYRRSIPPQSTLAIDGYGLAFHLYHRAYHRFYNEILSGFQSSQQNSHLPPWHLHLVPTFVPSVLIQREVRSFLNALIHEYHVNVHIYLDGKTRHFKSSTDNHRRRKRNKQWGNLEDFCKGGKLESTKGGNRHAMQSPVKPSSSYSNSSSSIPSADYFLDQFPAPTMFMTVFKVELELWNSGKYPSGRLAFKLVQCEDEADVHVAKASADDQLTFAVGWDTDFLIYGYSNNYHQRSVKYIPLLSLSVFDREYEHCSEGGGRELDATVLTRGDVARALQLPTEQNMIELAILMGNDYTSEYVFSGTKPLHLTQVVQSTADLGDDVTLSIKEEGYGESVVSYLIEMDIAYTIDGSTIKGSDDLVKSVVATVDFTRKLYSFGDISNYEEEDEHDSDEEDDDMKQQVQCNQRGAIFASKEDLINMTLNPYRNGLYDDGGGDTVIYHVNFPPLGRVCVEQKHLDAMESAFKDQFASKEDASLISPQATKIVYWDFILVCLSLDRRLSSNIKKAIFTDKVNHDVFFNGLPWLDYGVMHTQYSALSGAEQNEYIEAISGVIKEMINTSESNSQLNDNTVSSPEMPRCNLPIDDHEDSILESVRERQITIIHGETGCGKSSRVPIMLLRSPPPAASGLSNQRPVKMFVSQPRRIAAKSLVNRIRSSEPEHAHEVALRMGHGVREYETKATRLWFVTTGYLVRLLANKPDEFIDHTHLGEWHNVAVCSHLISAALTS